MVGVGIGRVGDSAALDGHAAARRIAGVTADDARIGGTLIEQHGMRAVGVKVAVFDGDADGVARVDDTDEVGGALSVCHHIFLDHRSVGQGALTLDVQLGLGIGKVDIAEADASDGMTALTITLDGDDTIDNGGVNHKIFCRLAVLGQVVQHTRGTIKIPFAWVLEIVGQIFDIVGHGTCAVACCRDGHTGAAIKVGLTGGGIVGGNARMLIYPEMAEVDGCILDVANVLR